MVIGFRASPSSTYWAVTSGDQAVPILEDREHWDAPPTLTEAQALSEFRSRALGLFDRFQSASVAVRAAELFGGKGQKSASQRRARIEGVLMEVANSRGIAVDAGSLTTISRLLGVKKAKTFLEEGNLRGIDLSSLKKELQEAVLVAVAALPKP
jgi:hypothetical protein